jgi:hypothetical protein
MLNSLWSLTAWEVNCTHIHTADAVCVIITVGNQNIRVSHNDSLDLILAVGSRNIRVSHNNSLHSILTVGSRNIRVSHNGSLHLMLLKLYSWEKATFPRNDHQAS